VPRSSTHQGTHDGAQHSTENAIPGGYAAIIGVRDGPSTSATAIAQTKGRHRGGHLRWNPDRNKRDGTTTTPMTHYALGRQAGGPGRRSRQHNGAAVNAISITSTATGPATAMGGLDPEHARGGIPKCTLTAVKVEVPNWQDAGRSK